MRRVGTPLVVCGGLALSALLLGPVPPARGAPAETADLDWRRCGGGAECATAVVPLNHFRPAAGSIRLSLSRLPATQPRRRIGSLFVNFGGPGQGASLSSPHYSEIFGALNRRYDIVGVDPRGVPFSAPGAGCWIPHFRRFLRPYLRPDTFERGAYVTAHRRAARSCTRQSRRNRGVAHVTTANFARDLNLLRAAVGDRRLNYLGMSWGTFLGATFQSLFPRRVGRMVLDSAVPPGTWINRPLRFHWLQARANEDALRRFLRACKEDQAACAGFGDGRPFAALERLLGELDQGPIPAGDERLNGDDVRFALLVALSARSNWGRLAGALAQAEDGDGSGLAALISHGGDGPGPGPGWAYTAIERRFPSRPEVHIRAGERAYDRFPHFWWTAGYGQLYFGLNRIEPRGAFRGPFRNRRSAPTTLVVGVTHDSRTPYVGSKQMVRALGNARLLTMDGDHHVAYPGESACIDRAVNRYLLSGALPPRGTVCEQDTQFESEPGFDEAASRRLLP